MPPASRPPGAARVASAARVLLLHPAWERAVGPVVAPVVVAVRLPAAVVVERPFAVGIGGSAVEAEPQFAPDLLPTGTAAEAAGIMRTSKLPRRDLGNSARFTELCSRRCREAEE